MKRQLFLTYISLLLAASTLSSAAHAQDAPVGGDIVKLNEEGIAAFQAGNFEEAATKFQQAYALEPENTLKKNEAVAWFKAGKCGEAVTAANQFLGLEGIDELSATEARAVVVKCDVQLAGAALDAGRVDEAERRLAEAKANQPDEEMQKQIAELESRVAAKKQETEEARQKALAAAQARLQAEAQAAEQQDAGSTTTLGLALTAAGGAVFLGAVVYHLVMLAGVAPKFRDVAAAGTDRAEYDRLGKRLETARWLAPTLGVVGLATAGVGVWLWMGGGESESTTPAASGWAPMEFGFVLGGRF